MKLPATWAPLTACALALAFAIPPTFAHEQEEGAAHAERYDCDHPPKDAVTGLPADLARFTALDCTPLGQRLIPGAGWVWRFPASWTDRPTLPAWTPEASQNAPGPKHFVAVGIARVADAELPALHQKLRKDSFTYQFNFDAPPPAMYRLTARNNEGHEMDVFYPVESTDRLWAIPCVPACRPEYAFMIERAPR